jgi:hypothetical protein
VASLNHALPEHGRVALEDVVRALASAQELFRTSSELRLRTLLAPGLDDDRMVHVATIASILDKPEPRVSAVDYRVGPFRVLGIQADVSTLAAPDDLWKQVTWWRQRVPDAVDSAPSTIWSRWYPSRNKWSQLPCWELDLSYDKDVQWNKELAEGPFFDDDLGWFSEDFVGVLTEWLMCPPILGASSSAPHAFICIPDARAHFADLSLMDQNLTARVAGMEATQLVCTLSGKDYDDVEHKMVRRQVDDRVVFELPRTLRTVQLHLWSRSREILDSFEETEQKSPWGRSVLRPSSSTLAFASLQQALEGGESDRVEFKAFVPPHRSDDKAVELLETVVAFANAGGGSLFVGVSDNGEILGLERELPRALKRPKEKDVGELRDLYAERLRKLIAESVVPSVRQTFHWHEPGGLHVLEIRIAAGSEHPYCVYENNSFFIRRGATNRRMTRADLELAYRRTEPEQGTSGIGLPLG